jgi:hypothetical protein
MLIYTVYDLMHEKSPVKIAVSHTVVHHIVVYIHDFAQPYGGANQHIR